MVVGEHVLFLLKAVSSGLIDKVPRVVREAQLVMAVQQREERKEFRRRASGLPVRRLLMLLLLAVYFDVLPKTGKM